MNNLGIHPYTRWIKARRGRALAEAFPKYDEKILAAYSETANLQDWEHFGWQEKQEQKQNLYKEQTENIDGMKKQDN